jgi:predicted DNA-binding transcriptional regulator AlpA
MNTDPVTPPGNISSRLVNERAAAEAIGVSVGTLRRMRRQNTGPAYVRVSQRRLRYDASELAAWLRNRVNMRAPAPRPADGVSLRSGGSPSQRRSICLQTPAVSCTEKCA